MANVNKVVLLGNLGQNPEVRFTSTGKPVCNFNLATHQTWTENGERQERTEWHRIVVWGKTAENCGKYLSKGRQVYLEGRLQTRSWQDREGQTRYTTEIVATQVVFLGSQKQANAEANIEAHEMPQEEAQAEAQLFENAPF